MNILNQFADPLDVIIHILFMPQLSLYNWKRFRIHYLHNQAQLLSPVNALKFD